MVDRSIRPSPKVSATGHPVGKRMKGNDGLMYSVAADKNGRHRWVPVSGKHKSPKSKSKRKTPKTKSKRKSPKSKSKRKSPKTKSKRKSPKSKSKRRSPKTKSKRKIENSVEDQQKIDKLENKLYNKMKSWWLKLAKGQILVLKKDGSVKFDSSGLHERYKESKDIRAIVWTGQSSDTLIHFVYKILVTFPAPTVKNLLIGSTSQAFQFVLSNFTKLFEKSYLHTKYDYLMKGKYSINAKSLIKKFNL